jgi:hypothetical protein
MKTCFKQISDQNKYLLTGGTAAIPISGGGQPPPLKVAPFSVQCNNGKVGGLEGCIGALESKIKQMGGVFGQAQQGLGQFVQNANNSLKGPLDRLGAQIGNLNKAMMDKFKEMFPGASPKLQEKSGELEPLVVGDKEHPLFGPYKVPSPMDKYFGVINFSDSGMEDQIAKRKEAAAQKKSDSKDNSKDFDQAVKDLNSFQKECISEHKKEKFNVANVDCSTACLSTDCPATDGAAISKLAEAANATSGDVFSKNDISQLLTGLKCNEPDQVSLCKNCVVKAAKDWKSEPKKDNGNTSGAATKGCPKGTDQNGNCK